MKRLQIQGDNTCQVIRLFGKPEKRQEPNEVRIEFPGGYIYVARVPTDNGPEYWTHTGIFHANHPDKYRIGNLDNQGEPQPTGKIVDARIDRFDKGASETTVLAGALDENVDHIAIRIRPERK